MDLDVSGLTEAEAARYRWMMERIIPFFEAAQRATPPFNQVKLRLNYAEEGTSGSMTIVLGNAQLEGRK